PNGGETWHIGATETITWTADIDTIGPDVRLGLHRGGAFLGWIHRRTENDGTYNWLVPDSLAPSSNYRIRVQSFTDNALRDYSDAGFDIAPAP
ncbi:MAG TPA: hypothetical protein ENN80_11835, partial [Candidatus Hydrogenedentes bacterium]|nr:hypothetical protein [Candidatus Hydrogenedentota bacterium]